MKLQADVMGKDSFMRSFNYHHELAFDSNKVTATASHGLHTDKGLPEQGNGFGWYSNNKLSYAEWYRIACARLVYDELVEATPRHLFFMSVGCLNFPWLAIGSGFVLVLSSEMRARAFYQDNGVQAAKKSWSGRIKCYSGMALRLTAMASIAKMVAEYFKE